jgi:signal transduction histidine kinase
MSDTRYPPRFASSPVSGSEARSNGSAEPIPDSESRFRALALAALDNQQIERSKLARMLHDEVAQILSAVGLQLDILRMDLEDTVPEIVRRTADIQEMLDHVVKRVRELSYKLNPVIVERAGLQLALDLLVGRFRKSFPGILRLNYDSSVRIPVPAAVAMEKIAEEAVANAIRHARCSQIEIIVSSGREGAVLQVRDDGTGFDHEAARRCPRGLGLPMMEYCATKEGLRLTVSENEGRGMTVRAVAAGPPQEDREGEPSMPGDWIRHE